MLENLVVLFEVNLLWFINTYIIYIIKLKILNANKREYPNLTLFK
jgi:hypothetical protein